MWDLPAPNHGDGDWTAGLGCWWWCAGRGCGLLRETKPKECILALPNLGLKPTLLVQDGFLLVWVLERWVLSKTQRAIRYLALIMFWLWGFSLADTGRKLCFFFQLLENKALEWLVLKDTCFWCCSRSNSSSLPAFGRGTLFWSGIFWRFTGHRWEIIMSFHSTVMLCMQFKPDVI